MIMRDGELATIIKQQEEEESHKSMDKEQQAMTSTPGGKDLLLIWRVLSLHHFSVFNTAELGRRLKSDNIGNGQYIFLRGLFNPYKSGI